MWLFKIPVCSDQAGSNRNEKQPSWCASWTWLVKGEKRDGVKGRCEAPLDNWTNGGSVDVYSTYGEYGSSSMGI